MQRLEVIGAVRPIYGSLGVKRLTFIPPFVPTSTPILYLRIFSPVIKKMLFLSSKNILRWGNFSPFAPLQFMSTPDMLPFSICNKKGFAIRHMNRPLFPTTSIPFYDIGK